MAREHATLAWVFLTLSLTARASLAPVELTISFRDLGRTARLSWSFPIPRNSSFDHVQTAYEIRTVCAGVHHAEIRLASPAPFHEARAEELVPSHASCRFAVRVWSASGGGVSSDWATSGAFASLPHVFAPAWITEPNAAKDSASTLLRKSFVLSDAPLSAVLSICGLGVYELTMNGERVGDHVMDTAWTKYTTNGSCLFSTFDVTAMAHIGENAVGVILGNGMYPRNMQHTLCEMRDAAYMRDSSMAL
jgi:alpha-L-rhamnosidase